MKIGTSSVVSEGVGSDANSKPYATFSGNIVVPAAAISKSLGNANHFCFSTGSFPFQTDPGACPPVAQKLSMLCGHLQPAMQL